MIFVDDVDESTRNEWKPLERLYADTAKMVGSSHKELVILTEPRDILSEAWSVGGRIYINGRYGVTLVTAWAVARLVFREKYAPENDIPVLFARKMIGKLRGWEPGEANNSDIYYGYRTFDGKVQGISNAREILVDVRLGRSNFHEICNRHLPILGNYSSTKDLLRKVYLNKFGSNYAGGIGNQNRDDRRLIDYNSIDSDGVNEFLLWVDALLENRTPTAYIPDMDTDDMVNRFEAILSHNEPCSTWIDEFYALFMPLEEKLLAIIPTDRGHPGSTEVKF